MPPKRLDPCIMLDCPEKVRWVAARWTKRNSWYFACNRHLADAVEAIMRLESTAVVRRYE